MRQRVETDKKVDRRRIEWLFIGCIKAYLSRTWKAVVCCPAWACRSRLEFAQVLEGHGISELPHGNCLFLGDARLLDAASERGDYIQCGTGRTDQCHYPAVIGCYRTPRFACSCELSALSHEVGTLTRCMLSHSTTTRQVFCLELTVGPLICETECVEFAPTKQTSL